MASDRTVLAFVRREIGLGNEARWPDSLILEEIERGKTEISREILQRMNNGGSLNIYDSEYAVDALENFVALRMKARKEGKNGPMSVSEAKRVDYSNPVMREKADKMSHFIRQVVN